MKINRGQLVAVLSEALDCVEKEVFGVTDNHAKRVAWLCIQMGKMIGMTKEELSDLALAALFHDNALNEFKEDYEHGKLRNGATGQKHCVVGEENIRLLSGEREQLKNFVLFHHECADGSGPFGKLAKEVPLGAQFIHIADEIDLKFALGTFNSESEEQIRLFIQKEQGKAFSTQVSEIFLSILSHDVLITISDKKIEEKILEYIALPVESGRTIAELFARVIDYKSPFTKLHSIGLAQKAERMARYYGYDNYHTEQLYMAASLHDIGKLFVDIEVLEKPGRLDAEEYKHIQSHAYETYRLLSKISGFEQIRDWASYHHEKLNGKGYPFGLTAQELNEEMRILACLDIYQALTEDRPYKTGMNHAKAISILYELAQKGELDQTIVKTIDKEFADETILEDSEKTALFQCQICSYIYEGDVVPDGYECPVCKQPASGFLRMK